MSRSYGIMISLVALAFAAAIAPVQAQRRTCQPSSVPSYDPAAEVTLRASVEETALIDCCCPRGASGTHLQVRVGEETIAVHLGPSDFIAARNIEFAKGDALEIVGSRVNCGDDEVVLARVIRKGDQTLVLRDEKGFPEWSRGHGRQRS